jgi:GST-like protein
MLLLYGSDGSGSAAIELALRRCGLAYELRRASTWEPDSAQAELQRINPLGQIPALRLEDGSVLTESAAILVHLGLTQPQSGLLPADESARAQAIRGLVYIAANCYPGIGIMDYPERWLPEGTDAATLDALRQGTRARVHRCWDVFADQFPATPFLGGGARPGALDFLAAVVSRWAGTRAHLRRKRPDFLAVMERVEADPDAAEVFARHWPPAEAAS